MCKLMQVICCFLLVGFCLSSQAKGKSADDNLYNEAQRLNAKHEYNEALRLISYMSEKYAAQRKVVSLKISAYTGICAVDTRSFSDALNTIGQARVLPFLLSQFPNQSRERINGCKGAEITLAALGPAHARTLEENLLMVLVGLAKIGNILSLHADINQDGTADPGNNYCRMFDGVNDRDLREVGTGMNNAQLSLEQINTMISMWKSVQRAFDTTCTDLSATLPGYGFCGTTDSSAFTFRQTRGIATVILESSHMGLGSLCRGNFSTCHCL